MKELIQQKRHEQSNFDEKILLFMFFCVTMRNINENVNKDNQFFLFTCNIDFKKND